MKVVTHVPIVKVSPPTGIPEAMAMLSPSAPVQATDRWGGPGMEVPQNEWCIYNGKSYQNG